MSIVTQAAPPVGRPTDAELVTALGLAALGKLTPEAATALMERLGSASASRAAHARAAGQLGGRPKGASAWYKVVDSEADDAWTRDLAPVGAWLGLTKGSLQTYLNRGQGAYHTMVQRDGRDIMVSIKYASATEKARLDDAPPATIPMWSPPVPPKKRKGSLT
jgi:hypothetical protein